MKLTNEEIKKVVNTTDKDLKKMDFKDKQAYYRKKRNLVKVVHKSRDKDGKGITYHKEV